MNVLPWVGEVTGITFWHYANMPSVHCDAQMYIECSYAKYMITDRYTITQHWLLCKKHVLADSCKQKLELFHIVFTCHIIVICAYVECELLIRLSHKPFVRAETEKFSRARNMHDWLAVWVQQSVPCRFWQATVASTVLVNCSLEHLRWWWWWVCSDHDNASAGLIQSTSWMTHATNLELLTRHMHAIHQHVEQPSGFTCCCKWLTDGQLAPLTNCIRWLWNDKTKS